MNRRILRFALIAIIMALTCNCCASENIGGQPYVTQSKSFKKLAKCKRYKCKDCVVFKESKQVKKVRRRKA